MPSLRFAPDRRLVQTLLVLVAIVASLAAPAGGRAQVCGDAVREAGESCDDGNQQSADGCDEHCRLERRRLDWWQPVFTVPPAGRIRDVLLAPAGILIREWDGIDEERYPYWLLAPSALRSPAVLVGQAAENRNLHHDPCGSRGHG